MNWFKRIAQQDHPMRQTAESLPIITQWQGMPLRPVGDSTNSISASSYKWEILDGIREIPYSMFSNTSISAKNSRETAYLQDLARQIQENRSIEPLIVVFDDDPSPYILEGVHRFDALHHMMGAQTLPAMVVLDWTPMMGNESQEVLSRSREVLRRFGQVDLYTRLQQLLPQLASAAQNEYNAWEQDEEGYDEMLGAGGICQEIASAFCDILSSANIDCTTFDAQVGDQHVWAVAYDDQEAFSVDIPPSVYETGTGYVWQKIPNVVFGPDDIVLERVRLEDVQASEGLY